MALDTVSNGTYFEFDPLCNAGALVMFKVIEIEADRQITREGGGSSTVSPVLVDFVVLDGPQAKTVGRGESIINRGIAGPLRRKSPGTDVVVRMGWSKTNPHGGAPYMQANAVARDSADWATAVEVMNKTGGDPYTHAERSANPTASLDSTAPAPLPPPAQPPAADAPAPWGAQPAPVGGPQGPGWGESPAATNAQPVAAGPSVW